LKRDPHLVCLSREHHDGLVLCLRIRREVAELNAAGLDALFADLEEFWEQALLRHFRAESECLLARLVRYVAYDDAMVERLNADHLALAALIADMRDKPRERRPAIERFGALLREHIRWEEEQLFEFTQRRLAKREMAALGRELESRLPPVCLPWLTGNRANGERGADTSG
jgi:hemerythrin-like domain-containing protein